ncbi:MAG: hypothetical protein HZA89_00500 [Verrucomicrobia bacterium]|nr:hypothetical protein [Verrucomicrobiota bacterium]
MKFLVRWAFRLLILLIVLLVAAVLLFDTIVKALLEKSIATQTGLTAQIGRVEVGLIHPKLRLENFTLYNSAEFGGSPMLQMPELHMEYDFSALCSRQVHLRLLRVNIGEVNEVVNAAGVDCLKTEGVFTSFFFPSSKGRNGQAVAVTNKTSAAQSGWQFTGIDTLNFTIGKLKRSRLDQPGSAKETNLDLNSLVLTNLTSAEDALGKLVSTVWIQLALKRLTSPSSSPPAPKANPSR